jgi:hypothetical protein
MDQRIAIDLAGRSLENARLQALGETKHVDCAVNAGLGRLRRVALIVDRRSRAGQVEDRIDLDIERKGDIVPDRLE